MTLKVRILRCLRRLFIILVSLTMTWFSEKMLISTRCIHGFMSNLIKKSWTDSNRAVSPLYSETLLYKVRRHGTVYIYRGAWKNKYGLPWPATACHGLSLNQHSDRACCFLNLVSGKIFQVLYNIYKQDLFMIFPTFPKTN